MIVSVVLPETETVPSLPETETTPEPASEAAPTPTEEPAPEATEEPAPEATEEPTPEPTEEPTPEATEEPAVEAMNELTPESPEEAVPETTEDEFPEFVEVLEEAPRRDPDNTPIERFEEDEKYADYYSVTCGSNSNRGYAEYGVKNLRHQGYNPFLYTPLASPNSNCIMIGFFFTEDEARA